MGDFRQAKNPTNDSGRPLETKNVWTPIRKDWVLKSLLLLSICFSVEIKSFLGKSSLENGVLFSKSYAQSRRKART